jgi:chromosome partitioning protein
MWTLAVWSRKGGSGKSTLSACLGVEAAAGGAKIALIDADAQGSLESWHRIRDAQTPVVAAVPLASLKSALQSAAEDGYAGAIVDFPGTLGPGERNALGLCDLVLVPMRPTPFDYDATATSLAVAAEMNVRPVVVLSQVRSRGREAEEVRAALAQRATVLPTEIGERIAFQVAIAGGLGVTESDPSSAAADEIRALLNDLQGMLNV